MGHAISAGASVRVADGVMACELGDGLALLHHDSGTFFVLDEVGAFIWSRLAAPLTTAEIAGSVKLNFDGDAAEVDRDVREFVQSMVDSALFRVDLGRP